MASSNHCSVFILATIVLVVISYVMCWDQEPLHCDLCSLNYVGFSNHCSGLSFLCDLLGIVSSVIGWDWCHLKFVGLSFNRNLFGLVAQVFELVSSIVCWEQFLMLFEYKEGTHFLLGLVSVVVCWVQFPLFFVWIGVQGFVFGLASIVLGLSIDQFVQTFSKFLQLSHYC